MRFGLVHRVMTDALAALGLLALVASGELSRGVSIALVVGLVAALAVPEELAQRPWLRTASTVVPVAVLLLQIARFAFGATVIELAVEFAAALQIVRLATRRGAAHDQQLVVLALLHLIAGTVLGGGLGYGVCFLAFLVVAPGALVLSHLRREVEGNYRQGARDRTGLPVDVPRILRSRRVVGRKFLVATGMLSVPIFVFTATLFVLFPRVGLSLLMLSHGRSGRMTGFSDKVDLGNVGTLRSDPTIALRVEVPDLPDPPPARLALHLRGAAFDTYDGRAWSRAVRPPELASQGGGHVYLRRPPDVLHDKLLKIDLEAIDPPVLFVPPRAVALQVRHRGDPTLGVKLDVFAGAEGELRYNNVEERGIRYDVWLGAETRDATEVLAAPDRARYLALPPDFSRKTRDLAIDVTRQATTPADKAAAIESHLRSRYRYDLSSPSGAAPDPVEDFLFVSKRGHCEFYSTAMVLMLRAVGVPSRNVTGFIGGTFNRFGHYYAVRQGDAHSWVEVFVDGAGWRTYDPTPPAEAEPQIATSGPFAFVRDVLEAMSQRWDRHVVGYDMRQQVYLFEKLSEARGQRSRLTLAPPSERRRGLAFVTGGALIAIGSLLWMRRRRAGEPTSRARAASARERDRLAATALYESLESAMTPLGIGRALGTPPLRHALALRAAGHPLAAEVEALTRIYLEARFGGASLSPSSKLEFEARVRAVRRHRDRPRAA